MLRTARLGYLPDSNLIARRIGPIYGRLVASPDYIKEHGAPETADDLPMHQGLLQGTEAWPLSDGDNLVALHPHGRFKADNGVALVSAALAGLGIAALPDFLTKDHLASGALVQVLPRYHFPDAGIYVVRPPGQHPDRKIRALTELLIQHFG